MRTWMYRVSSSGRRIRYAPWSIDPRRVYQGLSQVDKVGEVLYLSVI